MIAHLRRFALPLIFFVSCAIGFLDPKLKWWHFTIIMTSAAIWDWGCHSKQHHPELWSANILVRILGFGVAVATPILVFFFS